MKRVVVAACVFVVAIAGVAAQETSFYKWVSDRYIVYSDSSYDVAKDTAERMEACLDLYNDLFHFDTSDLAESKLRVRIFQEKSSFDAYLTNIISQTRKNFVYIHYSNSDRSELVGFQKDDSEQMDYALLSQGLIQFLKTTIPDPPLWLQEGTAIYVANSLYDPEARSFTYRPNYVWLEGLKSLMADGTSLIPLDRFLVMDRDEASESIDVFYPQSWGVVHFLLESPDKQHNRIYWDSLSALDAGFTLQENSVAVKRRAFSWQNAVSLERAFVEFTGGLKSFYDLAQDGIDSYKAGELAAAESLFNRAILLDSEHHVPHYYLGLIRYDQKLYFEADEYYRRALELGADEGLINYALGVNAYANKDYDRAERFLEQAISLDPEKYQQDASKVLQRISVER